MYDSWWYCDTKVLVKHTYDHFHICISHEFYSILVETTMSPLFYRIFFWKSYTRVEKNWLPVSDDFSLWSDFNWKSINRLKVTKTSFCMGKSHLLVIRLIWDTLIENRLMVEFDFSCLFCSQPSKLASQ